MSCDHAERHHSGTWHVRSFALILLCALATFSVLATSALAAAPRWELTSTLTPTNIPLTPTADQVELLTVTGEEGRTPNTGKFSLTFENNAGAVELTQMLPYAASAAEVQAALQALPIIGAGNVTVGGGPEHPGQASWTYTVTFLGALGDRALEELEVEESFATEKEEKEVKHAGGTPNEGTAEVNITTPGVGDIVEYELLASNAGDAPTNGTVTVADTLPAGLSTVTAPEGQGWSCAPAGEGHTTVTCTTSTVTEPGAAAAPIYIEAYVNTKALIEGERLVNSATVSGGGAGTKEVTDPAHVGGPDPVTEAASAVAQMSATLNATVNPDGQTIEVCEFEYGTSPAFGSLATCAPSPGGGESAVSESAALTGLKPDTGYDFRLLATNARGEGTGATGTFTTLLPTAPTAVTGEASALAQTSATLSATVNANAGEVSQCRFEYGLTDVYGASVPCASMPEDVGPQTVSGMVSGLSPNSSYHFRIVAANQGGITHGSDRTLTTLPATEVPAPGPSPSGHEEVGPFPAEPAPAPARPYTTPPSAAEPSLLSPALEVSSGHRTVVRLACTGTAECAGRLTLLAMSTVGHGGARHKRSYNIGAADFTIAPGRTGAIGVTLDSAGRALLRAAHGHLSAVLSVLTQSPATSRTQTASVRLNVPGAKG
jgi:uncharacterized repeat protein (TIGR01451 family)